MSTGKESTIYKVGQNIDEKKKKRLRKIKLKLTYIIQSSLLINKLYILK